MWSALATGGGGEAEGEGGSDVPSPLVPQGPSEHKQDGARRSHSCPDEDQMAEKDGSCGHSWELG